MQVAALVFFAPKRSTIDKLPSAQGLILIYEREQVYECRLRKSMCLHDCHPHGGLRVSGEDARPAVKSHREVMVCPVHQLQQFPENQKLQS